MNVNRWIALGNAGLTLISIACMVQGIREIKRKQIERHRRLMLAAFAASAIFAVSFVVRFARFGATPFQGKGTLVWVYRSVLYTHEPLAVINVPLATIALITGLKGSYRMHREIAPAAWRIWMYVSVTGVGIAILLYMIC